MGAPGYRYGTQETETCDRDEHLAPRGKDANVAQAMVGFGRHERLRRLRREAPPLQRDDHPVLVERPRIGDRHKNIRLPGGILSDKQRKTERGQRPTDPNHTQNPFVFPMAGVPAPRPEERRSGAPQFFLPVPFN